MNLVRTCILLLLVGLSACDGGGKATSPATPSPSENDGTIVLVTPVEKPEGVPETSEAIAESESLGQIVRQANMTPEGLRTRQIQDLSCTEGVMAVMTDEETIYAAIQCDGVPVGDQLEPFLEKEAAIQLEVTDERSRVLIETLDGSQAEFTVAGIWVE